MSSNKGGSGMLKKATLWILMILMVLGSRVLAAGAADVPRISKEELKSMLGNPDVVVIDVRIALDRNMSMKQIKGAIREDPDAVKSWAGRIPKEKTVVLY